MACLDNGYCSIQTYESGQADRLMPDELVVGELHVLMVAIEKIRGYPTHGRKPANCSARVACREVCQVFRVEETASGIYTVGFHIVEDDEVVWDETGGEFRDGFWTGITPGEDLGIDGERVVGGYLKTYADPLHDEIRRYLASQTMETAAAQLPAAFTTVV